MRESERGREIQRKGTTNLRGREARERESGREMREREREREMRKINGTISLRGREILSKRKGTRNDRQRRG